jgi:dTDP-4-amino-4,6-dideoxygalactose transaminase
VKRHQPQSFLRGQIDKYTWVDVGSSYLPSDMLAGFLYAQLEERDAIQSRRRDIWHRYDEALTAWAEENEVQRPAVPNYVEQAYHMYYLLLPSLEVRTRLIAALKDRGILSVFHYLPLHLSDMGQQYGGKEGDCPVTEDISDHLLRLPFFNSMTDEQQEAVIEALLEFDAW